MTDIKNCPFCGSESNLYGGGVIKDFFVCCENEECSAMQNIETFFTKEEAIEAWNRRV